MSSMTARIQCSVSSLDSGDRLMAPLRVALFLFVLLLGATAPAAAQTGTVKGTVTDAETGELLPGTNVVLTDTVDFSPG